MTCTCPKCKVQFEFDATGLLSEDSFIKCSECSADIVIRKESFALRALHKGDEISCAECGSKPGFSIYCQNCHAIYPDILIIETSSAGKRQFGKILSSLNAIKNFKLGGSKKVYSDSYAADPLIKGKTKAVSIQGKPVNLFIIVVVIIIALSAGGGYYLYQEKALSRYASNYVRAVIGVKMARDLNIEISARLSTDMKTGAATSITAAEQQSLISAKGDVDELIKTISTPPKKFNASSNSILKLYADYANLQTTVTSLPGSYALYTANIKKSDDNFKNSAKELKAGLPEKISVKLSEASKKFKTLQDF